MSLAVFLNKYRAKTLLLLTVLVSSVLGITNLLINFEAVAQGAKDIAFGNAFVFIGVAPLLFGIQLFYIIILGLALYFTAAFIRLPADIKTCIRLSIRSLIWTPLITLSDTVGFSFVGQKLIAFGFWGWLSYIPFFLLTFYTLRNQAPALINASSRQAVLLAALGTVCAIIISYPVTW